MFGSIQDVAVIAFQLQAEEEIENKGEDVLFLLHVEVTLEHLVERLRKEKNPGSVRSEKLARQCEKLVRNMHIGKAHGKLNNLFGEVVRAFGKFDFGVT